MKIVDIQKFINRLRFLNEAMSLNDLRKRLIDDIKGEGKSLKIFKKEQKWYDENKSHLIKTINMIVGKDKEKDLKSLINLDTEPYFINKELKPKTLSDDLDRKISATKSRLNYSISNNDGISNQYEMIELSNNVELYAVYTPVANSTLTHRILKTETQPTWCIASSSAAHYWNYYKLYNSYYPAVYIVAQKLPDGSYNDMKYELKCAPKKTWDFATYDWMTLPKLVDEWRNPSQTERTYKETSLFDEFKITLNELTEGVRKLMKSEKGKSFSKNFGKEMMDDFNFNIKKNKNNNERINFLIKACQNGTFQKFYKYVKKDEREFFIDRLIEYNNLFEEDVEKFEQQSNKKAILNLAKNKRCTIDYSLKWAADNFDNSIIKKVVLSIDVNRVDATLLDILWNKKMDDIANTFMERVLNSKIKYSYTILSSILKYDKEEYLKPILKLFKKHNDIHNSTLGIMLKYNKNRYIKSFLDIMMKSKIGLSYGTLGVICSYNKLNYIPYILDYFVKNESKCDYSVVIQSLLYHKIDKKYIHYFLKSIKENNPYKLKNLSLITTFMRHSMSDEILWCLENCNYTINVNEILITRFFNEFIGYDDIYVFKKYFEQLVQYFKKWNNREIKIFFHQLMDICFRQKNSKKSKVFLKTIFEEGLTWAQYEAYIETLKYNHYEDLTKYILKLMNEQIKNGNCPHDKHNIIYQIKCYNRPDMMEYVEKTFPDLIEEEKD